MRVYGVSIRAEVASWDVFLLVRNELDQAKALFRSDMAVSVACLTPVTISGCRCTFVISVLDFEIVSNEDNMEQAPLAL